MAIRSGTAGDVGFVRDLAARVFAQFGDYDQLLPDWLGEPHVFTVIAEEQGQPVGFAMLGVRTGAKRSALVAELLAIAVVPERQRSGIGQALLEHAEILARQFPLREIYLNTAETNGAARRFFQRAGFTVVGVQDHFYPAGQRALEMVKRVTTAEK